MNIWYFHHYAGGPGIGKFSRPFHLGKAWVSEGHRATIFVARYHHLLDGEQPLSADKVVDGVRYIALKARRYEGNGVRRILNMHDYCSAMLRLPRRDDLAKPDAIIVSSPHPFSIFSARSLARRYAAKLAFEVRDIWPLSVVEINGTPKWHPFVLACVAAERFAYRKSDLVVSLLAGAERHMRERGLSAGKFVYLPNGVEPRSYSPTEPTSQTGREARKTIENWHAEGRLVLIHPGSQGNPNALDRLLEAVAILNRGGHQERLGILLLGDGVQTASLKSQATTLGLRNVAFFPSVTITESQWLTAQCDIGYAGGRNHPRVYQYGISFNKIMDFMLAELPVVLPLRAGHDPVSAAGCGVVTQSDDPQAIAEGILKLVEEPPEIRATMGQRGKEYVVKEHDYKRIAHRYIAAIESAG